MPSIAICTVNERRATWFLVTTHFTLRRAAATDQKAVRELIRTAGINPLGLDWRRFVVAVDEKGQLIGCGQVKPHYDGTQELASIAVIKEWRGRGVARAIIERLMTQAGPPLWLICASSNVPLYEKFGFDEVKAPQAMSPYFRRLRWIAGLFTWLSRSGERLAVMVWDPPGQVSQFR